MRGPGDAGQTLSGERGGTLPGSAGFGGRWSDSLWREGCEGSPWGEGFSPGHQVRRTPSLPSLFLRRCLFPPPSPHPSTPPYLPFGAGGFYLTPPRSGAGGGGVLQSHCAHLPSGPLQGLAFAFPNFTLLPYRSRDF